VVNRPILRTGRDVDLYVEWSTIADGPTWFGTRAELLEYLRREWDREHPDCIPKEGVGPAARVARCDEAGTSVYPDPELAGRHVPFGAWNDAGFVIDGRAWLPRESLTAYVQAFQAGDAAAAAACLVPIRHDDEEVRDNDDLG
jgi:hypothetical protein